MRRLVLGLVVPGIVLVALTGQVVNARAAVSITRVVATGVGSIDDLSSCFRIWGTGGDMATAIGVADGHPVGGVGSMIIGGNGAACGRTSGTVPIMTLSFTGASFGCSGSGTFSKAGSSVTVTARLGCTLFPKGQTFTAHGSAKISPLVGKFVLMTVNLS